ncbi:MAG: endonuclease MutS2 [Gemella haemolysans]|uniref:endonuclease MutS2 n=1 Tax=Gemella haemolysans TaxID=1379 RepID=UPI00065FA5D3|nr:endonuclease MutS2 [Gemella haemolysans]MDU6573283.1 endonuclease MutS2 [Gemella haemolysans]PMC47315.1 endonuclease MutS2 [Streptococcus sp. UMB1385]
MNKITQKKLNLDLVLKDVEKYCFSELSYEKIKNLEYIKDYEKLVEVHKENEEGYDLLRKYPNEFKLKIFDYNASVKKAKIDSVLSEKELFYILRNIITYDRFSKRFENIKLQEHSNYPSLTKYVVKLDDFSDLERYLDRIIDEDGYIRPDASLELKNIKVNISKLKNKSDQILKNILRSNVKKLTEAIVTKRNDRDVILVKPEYKNDFGGIIHDESASGNTFYVEPKENVEINNEIGILKRKEKEEILRILKEASEVIKGKADELINSLWNFSQIEFIFSKMNFCARKGFNKQNIVNSQEINLKKAFNPLIDKDVVVKNDISLDNKGNSLIITGPNTGGKTVILKTVGLCVFLSHLGFYIPALEESTVGFFEDVFVDVGDEQSIENNLSTFSSHMTNIIDILNKTNNKSIILLDELCSGTDPSEGAVLSIALLEKFKDLNATMLCTTHYPEIKNYCFESEYYKNSSMEFDFEKLKPTYRFIIGLPGKSNAINISAKLGLEQSIIDEASSLLEVNTKENNLFIDKLSESIREYDYKLEYINRTLDEIDEVKQTLDTNLQKYEEYKESLYNDLSIELNREIEEKKEEMLEIYKEFKDNTSLKQHEVNELLHSMDKSKNNIRLQRKLENQPKFASSEIRVGDDVLVLSYNQRATVLEISGNTLQIKMGAMKLNIKKKEVRKIDSEPEVATRYVSTSNVSSKKVGIDINVIGLNTEEAIREIENYMDKVILQGYDTFTIIHGLGSGILRKNIGEYLKNNRYVASYRSGGQNEGGMGATVVEMK